MLVPLNEQRFIKFADIKFNEVGDGVRRKIMSYGPDIMSVYVEFKKGSIGALHRHPHRQITYIQKGSFKVHIGDETQVLGVGDHYYIPADIPHGVEALEDAILIDMFTPARADFLPEI
jgi:quercetin dioxygenase-like cupin family protein